jgi:ABC-type lipoprotein release transport system permease subunit
MHAAWILDLGDTKTGSSTSGLMFVFLPIYAMLAGLVGAVSGALVGWIVSMHQREAR